MWTGAIAALICLALVSGQHYYLRSGFPPPGSMAVGLLGGLAAGIVGGAAGQALFLMAPDVTFLTVLFRVSSWALLGGLAGLGLTMFIPNMRPLHGLMGGAVGGAAGAVGFLLVTGALGDLAGRLAGAVVLGFFVGLMVAIVEAAFRRAWLEVRLGPREVVTVNLGPEPVRIGGDARRCAVWARGAAPVALRYWLKEGQVICAEGEAGTGGPVRSGDQRAVGSVQVMVRTGEAPSGGTPPPAPPRPTAPPRPDPFDDLPTAPASKPSVPAPKPATPVASAPPPAPPRPSVPPRPAAPTSSPADASACPGCGKRNPGRPGARYCLTCDRTY